ncbi:hypothetical protein NIES4106_01320 [Fischerella sp. NIES-4106]|nr:hypothetical protein NIES4106_01320 [Fischerella sp. NIES-4106]
MSDRYTPRIAKTAEKDLLDLQAFMDECDRLHKKNCDRSFSSQTGDLSTSGYEIPDFFKRDRSHKTLSTIQKH